MNSIPLNTRLEKEITKLEEKFKFYLSPSQKLDLLKGITVGGVPSNTYEQAVENVTSKFLQVYVAVSLAS